MKLYATVTSERATKGQGGNQYLDINITAEGGEIIGSVKITQEKDSIGDITYAKIDFAEHVYVNGHHWLDAEVATRKGNKQKDECSTCGETGGHHSDDACEPYKG